MSSTTDYTCTVAQAFIHILHRWIAQVIWDQLELTRISTALVCIAVCQLASNQHTEKTIILFTETDTQEGITETVNVERRV